MKKTLNERILEENASKAVWEKGNERVLSENAPKQEESEENERILRENAPKQMQKTVETNSALRIRIRKTKNI